MPHKCVVPRCRGNYASGPKVATFGFPKDLETQTKWIKAICRENFIPTKHSRVCQLHFLDENIRKFAEGFDDKTGKMITVSLSRFQLKKTAVPSIFPNGLKYLSSTKKAKKMKTDCPSSDVQEQTGSVVPELPIVPNLDIVKKEPIDYTEEIPSTAQNIALQCSNGLPFSLKSEPTDDYMNDMTVPVNTNNIASMATSTIGESSSMPIPHKCDDSTEPPLKRPNLSLSPPASNTEIKDEFSIFADFVASKIRSFTDRHLQIEAQHRITNMLFEMELKDMSRDSLPVISKISSLEEPLSATVILPSCKNASLQPESPLTRIMPPSSTQSQISSIQTQVPVTIVLPSTSPVQDVSLETSLPSNLTASQFSDIKTQLPAAVTPPSISERCDSSKLQTQSPETMTLLAHSTVSINSKLPKSLPASLNLLSSTINKISNLQTPLPVTAKDCKPDICVPSVTR